MRIGIITEYYNSKNYGGLLQAYALNTLLNKSNKAETISFKKKVTKGNGLNKKKRLFHLLTTVFDGSRFKIEQQKYYRKKHAAQLAEDNRKKIELFTMFEKTIPHTKVYDKDTIKDNIDKDIFISGSDQVWNPQYLCEEYFLSFSKNDEMKIAYAASIGKNRLNRDELDYMIPKIKSFEFISVREKSAKALIQPYINKEVKVTLDPTILLNQNQWNDIEISPSITEPYLFVYLLGNNLAHRRIIKGIAKRLGYKIAFIPHVHMVYEKNDVNFADIEIYDAGPAEFVGWIKNAEMVITDSFHGCVFSIIYEKKFWALRRTPDSDPNNMNSRLYSLFDNLEIENRFLEDIDLMETKRLLDEIDYMDVNEKLNILRQDSLNWLNYALNKSIKKVKYNKNRDKNEKS